MMNSNSAALLDVAQVAIMSGLHRATIFKLVSAGKFPRPVKLGRSTRWVRAELTAWIAAKCPPCRNGKNEVDYLNARL